MAFMMPVVRNDYDIYANRSRRSSTSSSCPPSRRGTHSDSGNTSLSCSPGSDVEETLAAISLGSSPRGRKTSQDYQMPKSASQNSLSKFHSKVVDKLRKKIHSKEETDEEGSGSSKSACVPVPTS
ncbi:uncharacterized protein [Centruroides vittatus]|uniref:uncharacterized protein n=1 Tax=Centruroides vittatus TaxID=120091 RepID=UPI00350FC15E